MDKEKEPISSQNYLVVRNYSLENVPANSPGRLFVNPSEIYVMKTTLNGTREFSSWIYFTESKTTGGILDRPYVRHASFTLANDETISAHILLELLKKGTGAGETLIGEKLLPAPDSIKNKVICRFISNEELIGLIYGTIHCKLGYGQIIATDATTVAKEPAPEMVQASDLLAEHEESLSSAADFAIVTSTGENADQPDDSQTVEKPTLQEIEDAEEPEYVDNQRKKRKGPNYFLLALFCVIALCAGWAAVSYLPSLLPDSDYSKGVEVMTQDQTPAQLSDVHTETQPTEQPVVQTQDATTTASEPEPTTSNPSDEEADVKYLNENSIWDKSALKSPKYQAFYNLLATGSAKEIAESDYFAVTGKMTNDMAEKVVNLLWASNGTATQKANERELHKLASKSKLDLKQAYETLSRYRDKTPNTSPRPKR